MSHINGYFIPDEGYRAFANSMHTTYHSIPSGHGIPIRSIGLPGGFKDVFEGVFGNQPFAVLVFRFYGSTRESGQRRRVLDMDVPQAQELARRLRDKEFDNLTAVTGCRYRCAPTPYAKGTVELTDAMGAKYYAIAEQLVTDLPLDESFTNGLLGNRTKSGFVTDLNSQQSAKIGLCLARATSSVHEIGTHRDLKPANFAYGEYGGEGVVTLLDWGTLAEPVEGGGGTTVYNSEGFTAPEWNYEWAESWLYPQEWPGYDNIAKLTHSKQLDVYSLGATIAYLRCFHVLEGAKEMGGVAKRYREGFRKALSWREESSSTSTRVPLPFDLENALTSFGYTPSEEDAMLSEIVLGCTQPHPSERMTLQELVSSLEQMLDISKTAQSCRPSSRKLLAGKNGTRPNPNDSGNDGPARTHDAALTDYGKKPDTVPAIGRATARDKSRNEGTYDLWLLECSEDTTGVIKSIRQAVGAPLHSSPAPMTKEGLPYLAAKEISLSLIFSEIRRLRKLNVVAMGVSTDGYCQIEDGSEYHCNVVAYDPDTDQCVSWWVETGQNERSWINPEYLIQTAPTKFIYAHIFDASHASQIKKSLWHSLLIILITKESLGGSDTCPTTTKKERSFQDMSDIKEDMRIKVKTTDGRVVGASTLLCFSLELTGDDVYLLYQLDSDEVDDEGMETIHASRVIDMGDSYSLETVPDIAWPAIQEIIREIIRAESESGDLPVFKYGLRDKYGVQLL